MNKHEKRAIVDGVDRCIEAVWKSSCQIEIGVKQQTAQRKLIDTFKHWRYLFESLFFY